MLPPTVLVVSGSYPAGDKKSPSLHYQPTIILNRDLSETILTVEFIFFIKVYGYTFRGGNSSILLYCCFTSTVNI